MTIATNDLYPREITLSIAEVSRQIGIPSTTLGKKARQLGLRSRATTYSRFIKVEGLKDLLTTVRPSDTTTHSKQVINVQQRIDDLLYRIDNEYPHYFTLF